MPKDMADNNLPYLDSTKDMVFPSLYVLIAAIHLYLHGKLENITGRDKKNTTKTTWKN